MCGLVILHWMGLYHRSSKESKLYFLDNCDLYKVIAYSFVW